MSAGQNRGGDHLERFQRDLERMSSIQLLDLLTSQLITLEGHIGGQRPGRTRENVLRNSRLICSELRRREQQSSLF